MRFTFAVLTLAVSSASASIIARQIPSCADNCLFGSNVNLGGCSSTDNVCLCNSQVFVSTSTTCIESACSGKDLQTAISVAQQLCASVGVTLTSSAPAATDATSKAAETSTDSVASTTPEVTSASTKATSTAPSTS
ncbi:hypothetical protein C0991_008504, partial [Blastosporella zonata]